MTGDLDPIVAAVERLYEDVVCAPDAWNEAAFGEWAADVAGSSEALSRPVMRELRRCIRMAQRLQSFWVDPEAPVVSDAGDWRTRVDIALGPRAWRTLLDLARTGLEEHPSPELFDTVRRRFREVYSEPWLDGIEFDEWLGSR